MKNDNLTEATAKKLYETNFINAKFMFSFYDKYSFHWSCKRSNVSILVSYGGSSDDIYRYCFNVTDMVQPCPTTFEELKEEYTSIMITKHNEKGTKEFYWNVDW